MKKHLIAAAVAAAVAVPAMAQNVEIYGRLDIGYQSDEIKSTGATATQTVKTGTMQQGRLGGSRLGFKGSEDLGGGLKAIFNYELAINPDDQAQELSARETFVGLQGSFGTVRLGRMTTPYKAVYDKYLPNLAGNFNYGLVGTIALENGTVANSPAVATDLNLADNAAGRGIAQLTTLRGQNMVAYSSPSFSGFSFSAGLAKNDNDNSAAGPQKSTDDVLNLGLSYTAGPLSIDYSYLSTEAKAATTVGRVSEYEGNIIGASYDFGAAKVMVIYNELERKVKADAAGAELKTDRDDITLSVHVPMGATRLLAGYSTGEVKQGANKWEMDGYILGAIYSFSKRTEGYALYGDDKVKGTNANAARKLDRDGFTVGLRHSF